MNYWWVNQTREFDDQLKSGLIRSTVNSTRGNGRYRELVWTVKKNDLILHYHTRKGIIAVGIAKENAFPKKGYEFKCDYNQFRINKDILKSSKSFVKDLQKLQGIDGPIRKNISNFAVREGYLFKFSKRAYLRVKKLAKVNGIKWPI